MLCACVPAMKYSTKLVELISNRNLVSVNGFSSFEMDVVGRNRVNNDRQVTAVCNSCGSQTHSFDALSITFRDKPFVNGSARF